MRGRIANETFVVVVNPLVCMYRQDCNKPYVLLTDRFVAIVTDGHDIFLRLDIVSVRCKRCGSFPNGEINRTEADYRVGASVVGGQRISLFSVNEKGPQIWEPFQPMRSDFLVVTLICFFAIRYLRRRRR
jgi:hypothetical protein